jgi:anti-sigma-K factor RskA
MQQIPDEILDELTAYALDALEPAEAARVERLLEEQPELRRVLRELQETSSTIALSLPAATPPAGLRQRTLDRAVGRAPKPQRRSRFTLWLGGLAAAASVAAVLLVSQVSTLRDELTRAEQTIGALQADQQRLAGNLAQGETLVQLSGEAGRGAAIRTSNGETLVATVLPPLAAGRGYQLWVVRSNAAPVSAGLLQVGADGTGRITLQPDTNLVLSTDILAVTDEPAGGSAAPTTPILLASTPASA